MRGSRSWPRRARPRAGPRGRAAGPVCACGQCTFPAMARCFVTRRLPGNALERLAAEHEAEVWGEDAPPPAEELRARAAEADGLLTMLSDRVDAELIDAAPTLRAISNYAVGVD